MLNRDSFYSQSEQFLETLFRELLSLGVRFPKHWHIDHLCYRVDSQEAYQSLKQQIRAFATLLVESPVNGRNISTFELHSPVRFGEHYIAHLELPEPKPGSPYKNGIEHIEMVCDQPLEELPKLYPRLQWKVDRHIKEYNDELACKLTRGTIKFHHQSLASVVNLEKQSLVFSALAESKILSDLKKFHPLVVGTFPLDVQTENSDVDIVLSNNNLQEVEECFLKYYSYLPHFKMNTSCLLDRDTVIASFTFKNIPFELFAQRRLSFTQNGYRHFQVEERLLKIGGSEFKKKIIALRQSGLKTEPAFAQALSLKGDPYVALSNLFPLSDEELFLKI